MRAYSLAGAIIILMTVGCTPAKRPADVVIHNGTIYTANDKQPKAEAVAISGGPSSFARRGNGRSLALTGADANTEKRDCGLGRSKLRHIRHGISASSCSARDESCPLRHPKGLFRLCKSNVED
jgi:hypothetical protein